MTYSVTIEVAHESGEEVIPEDLLEGLNHKLWRVLDSVPLIVQTGNKAAFYRMKVAEVQET